MNLKNKRVLITAGPTWVPIDSVRVISNIATGETGILLANKLVSRGARVTLFLGPVGHCSIDKRVRLINFKFFDQLRNGLKKELRARRYDKIIHNAAVSDFKPPRNAGGKISSQKSHTLKLSPLPKIAEEIRKLSPKAKLVIFKLEAQVTDSVLIKKAISACRKIKGDIVVANRVNPYRAFIINSGNKIVAAGNRKELTNRLIKIL
jgi:phosphopantothenoylcysteine decarboxylase/phosphopantothenate--cysteine ligase